MEGNAGKCFYTIYVAKVKQKVPFEVKVKFKSKIN